MASPVKPVDKSVNKEAVRALVAVYGAAEAAKQSGVPFGTVKSWCFRYGWHKIRHLPRAKVTCAISNKGPVEALISAMEKHREESSLNLAAYTAKASRKAADHADPLAIARNVRDVASVYSTVWPPDEGGEMVEGAILVGGAPVKDDPSEMLEVIDVREALPDAGPQGD